MTSSTWRGPLLPASSTSVCATSPTRLPAVFSTGTWRIRCCAIRWRTSSTVASGWTTTRFCLGVMISLISSMITAFPWLCVHLGARPLAGVDLAHIRRRHSSPGTGKSQGLNPVVSCSVDATRAQHAANRNAECPLPKRFDRPERLQFPVLRYQARFMVERCCGNQAIRGVLVLEERGL